MKIGFSLPMQGGWATPHNQLLVAGLAEELGYESVWTLQRLLNPAESTDPTYRNVPDPIVTLAYVAARTSRVRLGIAILNLPFFSPALLAKQLTTLDIVSGGRLDAGLGLGWMPEEFAASGLSMERRGARGEEFLAVLKSLWTDEISQYEGEFYRLPAVRLDPKPVQKPHPPILLGGVADSALRRVGRQADGWISRSRTDLTRIGDSIQVIRVAAEVAGRDPSALRFVCRGVLKIREAGAPNRAMLTGSYDEVRGDLARLEDQGVTEVFYDLNFDPQISGLDADPVVSIRRAEEALRELAQ